MHIITAETEIHTFLSNLCKDPEGAWRCSHISGKPHQQLEYRQLGAIPQHYQQEVCRTAFHSSPVNQKQKPHYPSFHILIEGLLSSNKDRLSPCLSTEF